MNNVRFSCVMSERLRQQVADVANELEMTDGQVVRFALAEWMAQRALRMMRAERPGRGRRQTLEHPELAIRPAE
jgi:hypothetical protein